MNQLAIYENRLPSAIKADMNSDSPVIQTVKTEKELESVKNTVEGLKRYINVPASASELDIAINELFILQASSNSTTTDTNIEKRLYIKNLAGLPLWAIQKAVDITIKRDKFRNFATFYQEIEKQTDAYTSKISRLRQIYKKSVEDMKEEEEKQAAWNSKPTEETIKLAEEGNQYAKIFAETKGELDNE